MTTIEIVAVTAALLLNGYLAISEFRTDFSQRSHMKRLAAEGYARLRAALYRRRYHRRVHRKKRLGVISRGTVRSMPRVASEKKPRLHREVLSNRSERERWKEGEPADNHDDAGQQGNEKDTGCRQGPGG
jgi:hypothetical protein